MSKKNDLLTLNNYDKNSRKNRFKKEKQFKTFKKTFNKNKKVILPASGLIILGTTITINQLRKKSLKDLILLLYHNQRKRVIPMIFDKLLDTDLKEIIDTYNKNHNLQELLNTIFCEYKHDKFSVAIIESYNQKIDKNTMLPLKTSFSPHQTTKLNNLYKILKDLHNQKSSDNAGEFDE